MKSLCNFTLGLLVVTAGSAFAGTYTFQTVIYPNDNFTQLLGINNSGTIAGYHGNGLTPQTPNQGFTLTLPNNFTAENYPGSVQTQVVGINSVGMTVGFYVDGAGVTHGFQDLGGSFSTVDAPGTAFNQLLGVNTSGEEAGYSSTDPTGATNQQAFVDQNGTFIYLTGLFSAGTLDSQATGVNNNGLVSGFFVDGNNVTHGFEAFPGAFEFTFDAPNSTFTQVLGINNESVLVGDYMDMSGATHGFVFNDGMFTTIDDPLGIGTTTVNGINDLGQLVGFYVDANGNTDGFVATPAATPEPVSMALTGLALCGLGLARRKRCR